MEKQFNFGAAYIFEMGTQLSKQLHDGGIEEQAILSVFVGKDEFKKIDEDLFYRNRKDEEEKFIPSEGEIDINFDLVKIKIKERQN